MKYLLEYLINERKIKPLGELTFEDDLRYDLSGVIVFIDGKDVDIFISHIDYCNFLERCIDICDQSTKPIEQNL